MLCMAVFAVILFVSSAAGAERVVLAHPEPAKKELAHIITVAAEGGDFTDPVAAVDSIADADVDNPYLVMIGPGEYTLIRTLVMKPFVTISGADQEATILTGAISTFSYDAASAVVAGADNATLLDLTVRNTGGSGVAIAIYNDTGSPVIQNVIAAASGARFNYGVYNEYGVSPVMTDVTATASGGMYNYGVFNSSPPRGTK
jgi:pectin methylesterase-like acyl-CoA thioesterase